MSFYSLEIILFLIILLSKYETKFIDIKSLSFGYFAIFDDALIIYYSNFTVQYFLNYKSEIVSWDNITIIRHVYNENIYIFCLIGNYLYIYDDKNEKIVDININEIIDKELLNYRYYKIIPYNTYNNDLNLIITTIKEEKITEKIGRNYYDYLYYYNYYLDFNININTFEFFLKRRKSFKVEDILYRENNLCHILDSTFIIKCIYYDDIYFFPLQYKIQDDSFQQSSDHYYYTNRYFNKIASSKSDKNNYLVCPFFKIKTNCNRYGCYYYNYTYCKLCDENHDFDLCSFIEYSQEYHCLNIETYFFSETNEFAFLCKTFNEFILLIIDHTKKRVIQRKIIHINCIDNLGYNGNFSLLYNSSFNYYNLITELNFTENPTCSLVYEENEDENINFNKTKNITNLETISKEFAKENSDIAFSEFSDGIISDSIGYINNNIKEEIIIETTNKTKEDIIDNIKDTMNGKEIGKIYEIKGDDFTLIIKPTNTSFLHNKTRVEFDECEKILRKENNISNSSIITIFQMEINNNDEKSLYNQIIYTTFDEKLNELDLSVCQDVKTQIHYFIKDDSKLNIDKVSNFKNIGVDILNINDDFFTNLCYAFSDSNKDMILEDRIKYIFENYSLCEEGCTYNYIDIEQRSISCNCKIKGNISTILNPLVFDSGKEISFFDSNIGVSKCYNLVFSSYNKMNNIGFIIFCILIIIYFIIIIIQIKKGIKPVCDYLHKEMILYGYLNKNDPKFFENKKFKNKKVKINNIINEIKKSSKKINENNFTDVNDNRKIKFKKKKRKKKISLKLSDKKVDTFTEINDKNKESKDYYNSNKSLIFQNISKSKKIKIENNKNDLEENYDEDKNFGIVRINPKLNPKKFIPKDSNQSLFNYTFEEAIEYDKRNIIRVFYIYLLSKQIIFRTFLQKSPVELFPLRFTLFIFMLSCDLALNALFYFNDNISKKYHNASNLFLFTFNNNITIIIYSTLISYFILTLLSKLSNSSNAIRNIFRNEEYKMKKNKNYTYNEKIKIKLFYNLENILKKFKLKIFILIFIEIISILFFWYFVTAFCHVYSSTQTSWILDSFLAILSRFILEIIFGFLFAKLYCIAVVSNIKTFYNILLCIYNFS